MRSCLGATLAAFLCLGMATGEGAAPLPHALVFFSSNTNDGLDDASALAALTSFNEVNAIAVADRAGCALAHEVQISAAVGVYPTGAENSVVVQGGFDAATANYLAALLGRYEHQEWEFSFVAAASGPQRFWELRTAAPLAETARQVRALGLAPATVRTASQGSVILFVGPAASAATVGRVAAALKATVASEPGVTARLGSDQPGIAGAVAAARDYDRVIAAWEVPPHPRLSASLWSAAWRDATGPTCSKPAD